MWEHNRGCEYYHNTYSLAYQTSYKFGNGAAAAVDARWERSATCSVAGGRLKTPPTPQQRVAEVFEVVPSVARI